MMTRLQDEFELRARQEAQARRWEAFEDLQRELGGVQVLKEYRFLNPERRERVDPARREASWREWTSALLLLLLTNPAYAALYEDVFAKLRAAEDAAERALSLEAEARDAAGRAVEDLRERAQRLPDGTVVFKDKDSAVWTEHGGRVSSGEAAALRWRGDEPSYEGFMAATDKAREAQAALDELRGVQVEIGGYRHELTDEDHPPSEERLEEIGKDVQGLRAKIERNISTVKGLETPTAIPPEALIPVSFTAIAVRELDP
jgi:hypothetical protein